MKRNLYKALVLFGCPACLLLGMISLPAYRLVKTIIWGKNVQVLESPETNHRAALIKKYNIADINFIVKVDGEPVYESADLMPFPDHMYRETLVWDKTGRVVVLELMGKRVFAYDTVDRKRLGKGELKQYQLYPMPSDYVYIDLKDIDE